MDIKSRYDIGSIVFLATDQEQKERMVIQIAVRPGNVLFYELSNADSSSWHYEFEILPERDIVKATSA